MNCNEVREQLDAYALGALEPEEHARVAAHLADCPECQQLALEREAVVSQLPLALAVVSEHRLPPALKDRVLAALERLPVEAAGPRDTGRADTQPLSDRSDASVTAVAPATGASVTPRWISRWRPRQLVAAAAMLVILVGSVALSLYLRQEAVGRERAIRAEFESLVDRQEIVLEVVDSPKTIKATLRPPTDGSNAYGKLFTRPDLPSVVIMANRLPQPDSGQEYHVWLSRNGTLEQVGVLKLNDTGFGILVFDAEQPGPVYESAQITLQPEGASTPDADPVLVWQSEP